MPYKRNDKLKYLISDKTTEDCWILFPDRYYKVGLADHYRVFGVVAVANAKNEYCLMNLPIKAKFNYTEISVEKIQDIPYKKMHIAKGTPMFVDHDYISTKDDTYIMLNDWLISSNNVPFYVGYDDMLDIFLKNNEMVGGDLAEDIIGISMLISIAARDDKSDFYRLTNKNLKWVGLSNKNESYKNLSSMLVGTYLTQGIDGALLLEEDDKSALSKMMKS